MLGTGKFGRYIPGIQTLVDIVLVNALFVGLSWIYGIIPEQHFPLLWGLFAVSFLPISIQVYITHLRRMMRAEVLVRTALILSLIYVIIFAALTAFFKRAIPTFGFFSALFGALVIGINMAWLIELSILKRLRRRGYNSRNVVIVGTGPAAMELTRRLVGDRGYGYIIHGYFDETLGPNFEGRYLGTIDDLEKYCLQKSIDEIYYTLSSHNSQLFKRVIQIADGNFCRFYYIPLMNPKFRQRFFMQSLNDSIPAVSIHPVPLRSPLNKFIKRTFDVVFSSICLICSPVIFIPVAIGIKLTSPGPVFFKQKRTGYMGNEFYCYKFRTMRVNKDADNLQATKNDNRKTRFGDFLRRTSIDELPQFWNVLKGDMSVVGPRPHMLLHTEEYRKLIGQYMVRHLVKPGITGWAQVLGYRGATDELWQMEARVDNDVWYIENWSFLLDMKIIVKTITNAIHGEENAY